MQLQRTHTHTSIMPSHCAKNARYQTKMCAKHGAPKCRSTAHGTAVVASKPAVCHTNTRETNEPLLAGCSQTMPVCTQSTRRRPKTPASKGPNACASSGSTKCDAHAMLQSHRQGAGILLGASIHRDPRSAQHHRRPDVSRVCRLIGQTGQTQPIEPAGQQCASQMV